MATITATDPTDAHPYLRAATAGIRHHARSIGRGTPADRRHLDNLHEHVTRLHLLLDQLAETVRPEHPTSGRHLATAHLRLWQATASLHDAFHTLPAAPACTPDRLPDGPLVLTICQRHLASGHAVRRKTTPADHGTA
ncbi:DUF6238 family protein [Streptomyces venezuelae]|uniref:Uncharacterized protein n=3 Tax=Streptomyces venezuelae TaxID=54571 RepID=F2R8A6_STRVP|nr:hypothetical protein SVEN_5629 [Streptomyces venezuelae ATCC 10712]